MMMFFWPFLLVVGLVVLVVWVLRGGQGRPPMMGCIMGHGDMNQEMQAKTATEILRDAYPAEGYRENCQDHQRNCHRPGSFMSIFGFFRARLAQESQGDLAHCVKSGQQRCQSKYHKHNGSMLPGICQNFILRPESRRDKWEA